jgi:glycosyltransferase involved in cell wall biosynthesis
MMNKISAIIITKNEAVNIERCLDSVKWVDEVIVVDSGSTDSTRIIAEKAGARLYDFEWNGFGPAKEFARIKASGDWILSIDADEVVTSSLAEEIKKAISNESGITGYYLPRQTNFQGKWIRHSGWWPDYVLRLFKKSSARFSDALVHETVSLDGPSERLQSILRHYSYPDLSTYMRKLDKYSSLASEKMFRNGAKCRFYHLLFKPPLVFFRHYLFKAGFLDGWEGFLIAVLSGFGTFLKYARLKTLQKGR